MATYRLKNATPDKMEELARISHNLRHYSKIWKEHYGKPNLDQMQEWEKKMDTWLKENVDYTPITHLEIYYKVKFSTGWVEK